MPPANSLSQAPRIANTHSNSESSHATAAMSGLEVVASSLSSRMIRFTAAELEPAMAVVVRF